MPRQHVGDFHRHAFDGGFFHGLQQGNGDDAFGHIGPGRLAGFEAAREVLDVILVLAGVMALAFEAEVGLNQVFAWVQ